MSKVTLYNKSFMDFTMITTEQLYFSNRKFFEDKDFVLKIFNINPSMSFTVYLSISKILQKDRDIGFFCC